jgi:transcriptional regulator of heat shock response
MDLSTVQELLKTFGWFLRLGEDDTKNVRREVNDLLTHACQSLQSLLELSDALEDLPIERFNNNAFWPIQRHCLVFSSSDAVLQVESHCIDIQRDIARINFRMAKVLRTEVGNWKEIDEAFKSLITTKGTFLGEYKKELQRIDKELQEISDLLNKGKNSDAWEKYGTLRSSLMQDRESLREQIKRMDEAEQHIRRLLT